MVGKSNKIKFTLPYPNKARLQRVMSGRSNVEVIKEDCIYPYDAQRKDTQFLDKFELNEINGRFIGLFLADGCVDLNNNCVRITKNNKQVQEFVIKYFKSMNINYDIETKTTTGLIQGTSETIRGHSSIFSLFLYKLVGHTCYHKFVPNEAFNGSLEFARGIISGFFSGDGCITSNNISACSTSKLLIYGINILLNRFNIFSKITTRTTDYDSTIFNIDIISMCKESFKNNFELIEPNKQEKLKNIKLPNRSIKYIKQNDVIFDKIKFINKISSKNYKKVYDITVPETYNFQLFSGLQCRDTATTGYIQRKMIKMVEDLKFNYTNNVTNANDSIVEFMYGEDNMDPSKLIQTSKGFSFIDINHVCEKLNNDVEWNMN